MLCQVCLTCQLLFIFFGPYKALIKAKNLGLNVNFKVDNALYLKTNKKFDTVIDCGLFHILSENDRSKFEKNLFKGNVYRAISCMV